MRRGEGERRAWIASLLALPILACAGAQGRLEEAPAGATIPGDEAVHNDAVNPLYVAPTSYDFSQNPKLLGRILGSPHGYFRFINRVFATETCRRLAATVDRVPIVNLHGDAHIEQYAVTDLGRGLTDFDDSTSGPAVVDLLRFGVSIRLACAQKGWDGEADGLFDRFLAGYRAGLEDPKLEAPMPKLAARIRAGFEYDRTKYFAWITKILGDVSAQERAKVEQALRPYVRAMRAEDPTLGPHYFDVRALGRLRMGIGSALDLKYLVRVEGPTEDPLDDVVLEIKEVRDLRGVSCVSNNQKIDAFRILVGQSRIAYEPYRLLGYLRLDGRVFWIHSWVDNYRELDISDPEGFGTVEELAEVVYDVGVQLGRGHPAQIAAPLGMQLRMAQLQMLDESRPAIVRATRKMAADVQAAWLRFKTEAQPVGAASQ